MKAGQRLGMVVGVAALALAALPARAQEAAAPPPAETPETNSIGPRELQNYSIDGTVTRRADPPAERPAQSARTTSTPPRTTAVPSTRDAPPTAAETPDRPAAAASDPLPAPVTAAPLPRTIAEPRTAPASSVTVPLPPIDGRMADSAAAAADFPDAAGGSVGSDGSFSAWPWLLAAIALALGGLFLWRSRARHALAGYASGPEVHAFVAPEPRRPEPRAPAPRPPQPRAFAPRPDPAPRVSPPAPAPQSLGVVSTRLRPRLDISFKPLRCTVDGDQVVVEFELELINSGSAPARGVLIEASLFNAGQGQDQAIGAFFANPVGQGERIAAIAPLKRFPIRSQVIAPRANVQLFNIEGREVFVPLIAFNALYAWSGGDAQSSSAYLVGRDTGSAKLAPFRADLGARQFTGLGARPLPAAVSS